MVSHTRTHCSGRSSRRIKLAAYGCFSFCFRCPQCNERECRDCLRQSVGHCHSNFWESPPSLSLVASRATRTAYGSQSCGGESAANTLSLLAVFRVLPTLQPLIRSLILTLLFNQRDVTDS
jgi:hypothetical protein